jgi:hypothetical protein
MKLIFVIPFGDRSDDAMQRRVDVTRPSKARHEENGSPKSVITDGL